MIIGQDKFFPRWHWPNILALPQSLHLDLAYAVADKRDLRIDLLRGFAVFVMIVDHFGGASWLYLITGNNSFFVSGAEAFVFISGIVVGMVYGGIALKNLQSAQWKALERAWTLYKLTIALTLIFAVISKFFLLPWADAFKIDNPFTWLVDVVTLHRTFYLADVMLMYTVLMVGAAGALWLLIHHRTGVLLAASLGIWLAFQIAPAETQLPWHIEGNGTFNLAAWQLLFFGAMALGFHRERVAQAFRRLPRAPYFVLSGLMLGVLGAILWRKRIERRTERADANLVSEIRARARSIACRLYRLSICVPRGDDAVETDLGDARLGLDAAGAECALLLYDARVCGFARAHCVSLFSDSADAGHVEYFVATLGDLVDLGDDPKAVSV